jgi:hypothetical protein
MDHFVVLVTFSGVTHIYMVVIVVEYAVII